MVWPTGDAKNKELTKVNSSYCVLLAEVHVIWWSSGRKLKELRVLFTKL